MQSTRQVHWHEGLFLQPHHLQAMQRQVDGAIVSERHLNWPHPYGVIEYKISEDELANMRVRFEKLRVMMPGGVLVEAPGNAALPALDIREAFQAKPEAITVYVGVPLWYGDRANTVEGQAAAGDWWRVKCLYQVEEAEVPDENTGTNPKPLLMRKINARLILKDSDKADLEVLPLLRIRRSTGENAGVPVLDKEFVPPCMILKGSRTLYGLVKDLSNQVEASRTELVNLLTRGGFQIDALRGVQIEQLMRLRSLSRMSATLPSVIEAAGTSPFAVYLELAGLLGELAALQPDTDPFKIPAYVHDDPGPVFKALDERIRPMLHGVSATSFFKEPFLFEEAFHAWIAKLSDDDLSLANEYFLAVKTRQDPVEVAKLVEDPDRFKLMPKSIVSRRVRGITLKEERHPPIQLPAETGMHYFRLHRDQNPQIWEQITKEKEIGVTWVGLSSSDYALTLFMTVPEVKK